MHKGCVLEAKLIGTLIGAHHVQLSQCDQDTAAQDICDSFDAIGLACQALPISTASDIV